MKRNTSSFRVGKVRADLRGRIWYLAYFQNGKRHRPRVGPDRDVARQLTAQTNAQLEMSIPAALNCEPLPCPDLQKSWLDDHEQVRRSSVQTINRYRAATQHLLTFLKAKYPGINSATLQVSHVSEFVRYLRTIEVSPNGHRNSAKRRLLDKGVKFILEACRAMFQFAIRRRHLYPYAENPFVALDLDRIPIDDSKPIRLFTSTQEKSLLEACDDWQFPIVLTLLTTGLRPGELLHLLLPHDVDLQSKILHVRNKPRLGWQVKTRSERAIPLIGPVANVLRVFIAGRTTGPLVLRRRFINGERPALAGWTESKLEQEVNARANAIAASTNLSMSRARWQAVAKTVWCDAGFLKTDALRKEFLRLMRRLDLPDQTAPKILRHQFATALQDANVDALIRNELMGHAPAGMFQGQQLGMTAVYTHTRFETKRAQLEKALENHVLHEVSERWLQRVPQKSIS